MNSLSFFNNSFSIDILNYLLINLAKIINLYKNEYKFNNLAEEINFFNNDITEFYENIFKYYISKVSIKHK